MNGEFRLLNSVTPSHCPKGCSRSLGTLLAQTELWYEMNTKVNTNGCSETYIYTSYVMYM